MPIRESEGFVPGIRPYFDLDDEGLKRIADVLASGQASNNGPYVQEFEMRLAGYLGVREAVLVSTGADGLLLTLKALCPAGGKAILPAYTYIATLNAVVHAGLEPVFCEINERTYTIDTGHLAELFSIDSHVRCVLPVNVFGVPADLKATRTICEKYGAKLLYDNAHGFGTEVEGRRIQSESDAQVFSLHATKTLPAVEGGLVVSDDPSIVASVRRLRNHGLAPNLKDTVPGFNSKMDEIRAVIGLSSLAGFDDALSRRRMYGNRLVARFGQFPDIYQVQKIPHGVITNFQNLGVRCLRGEDMGLQAVMELFRSNGVGVRSYFDPPLYKIAGFDSGPDLPVTEAVWRSLISFPIHSRMTELALARIEDAIGSVAEILTTRK